MNCSSKAILASIDQHTAYVLITNFLHVFVDTSSQEHFLLISKIAVLSTFESYSFVQ